MEAVPTAPPQPTFLGHPVGLFVLFFTEMWERFSYYGMRGLLKLYMANYLFVTSRQIFQGSDKHGLGDPNAVVGWTFIRHLLGSNSDLTAGSDASLIYGWYIGLVYLTPLLGGFLADRYWGQRKTVFLGGILMAIGHFLMAIENWFFFALLLLIIGNGAFKPNISTQVGNLYPPGDPRRDRAFTIFYMGINLGAFICMLICGTLAANPRFGWHWGFGAAGVGMVLGLIVYSFGQRFLTIDNIAASKALPRAEQKRPLDASEWRRILALIFLCVLNISFWAVYEQQGNTMQTWADENTAWPKILGFQVPSTWFQSFNSLFILILAPPLDMLWAWQARRGREPSSVAKMALGCIILGLSFIIMVIGAYIVGDSKGSLFWPVFCTLIVTVGELYLSPIGLSLVSKVSPARIISLMMGMWFISSFFGNVLSGYIGKLYENKTLSKPEFFWLLTGIGVATGLAIWAFASPLKKAMAHCDKVIEVGEVANS